MGRRRRLHRRAARPAGRALSGTVVRRAGDRFVTRTPGVRTWHAFSFGPHYDPAHVAHGRLVAHDEHLLAPGAGFGPHPHRDLELLTWVLSGALHHEQDGRTSRVPAGTLQRLVAGDGVVHDERAGSAATRFLQLWLTAPPGTPRSYAQHAVGELAEVVPGVHAGRVDGAWTVPDLRAAHLHVAAGTGTLAGTALAAGDAVRLDGAGPLSWEGSADLLLVDVVG